jgi:hypothetical protein
MMVIFALQTILPLVLFLWLAILPPRNKAGFWLLGLTAALLILMAALQGIWVFPPWWMRYLIVLLLVGAVTFRLIRAPVRPWLPSGLLGWLCLVILGGIAGWTGAQSWTDLMDRQIPAGSSIALAWPLGPGIYVVANGGAAPSINAHAALLDPTQPLHAGFGGSGYGVDLIAVNGWGLRASSVMPDDPARYAIFGTPVLAPCVGEVVLAEGARPDMTVPEIDERHPAGNHILLRCDGFDILLAHFRQGSLRVAVGDILAVGQQIVEVGNSGESAERHLHIHAQIPGTPDAPYSGTPVPIRLEGRFLVRNDLVEIGVRPEQTNP